MNHPVGYGALENCHGTFTINYLPFIVGSSPENCNLIVSSLPSQHFAIVYGTQTCPSSYELVLLSGFIVVDNVKYTYTASQVTSIPIFRNSYIKYGDYYFYFTLPTRQSYILNATEQEWVKWIINMLSLKTEVSTPNLESRFQVADLKRLFIAANAASASDLDGAVLNILRHVLDVAPQFTSFEEDEEIYYKLVYSI